MGSIGPRGRGAYPSDSRTSQKTQETLIVSGRVAPCGVKVHTWFDHGMRFKKIFVRKKTTKIVLHWTGAENPAEAMFANMSSKRRSVHFAIDQLGKVWQFADAGDVCWHAGHLEDGFTSANDDTVGIEIVNRASRKRGERWMRPMLRESIHGNTAEREWFLPAQVDSARSLCRALCDAYGLPMAPPLTAGKVVSSSLSTARWRSHRGIVGHFHARDEKLDPGPALLASVCDGVEYSVA